MEQQNGTVMKMVLNKTDSGSVMPEGAKIVNPRDVATKFFWDNQDVLESLIAREKERLAQEEAQKLTVTRNAEDAERLVSEFLERRDLRPCEEIFFKIRACDTEPTIYLFVNIHQATTVHAYFNEIRKHFSREWSDPEYGLLETRRKIQNRIRALYNIQHIYPSKSSATYKMQPISTNGHPKLYHYINNMGCCKRMMDYTFTELMPWETTTPGNEENFLAKRNYLARSIIKDIDDDIDSGTAIAMSFSNYIRGLGEDMVDFMELEKWMSLGDKIANWGSYRLIKFFLKIYDNILVVLDK